MYDFLASSSPPSFVLDVLSAGTYLSFHLSVKPLFHLENIVFSVPFTYPPAVEPIVAIVAKSLVISVLISVLRTKLEDLGVGLYPNNSKP